MKRFTLGSSSIGKLEKHYALEVLDNNYVSPGPVVDWVEKECALIHNMKHGLCINSGQSAIHVAIQAIVELHLNNSKRKPLVAVPACTYISTLAAAILAGCDVILVDVDPQTGNMCHKKLQEEFIRQAVANDPIDIVVPVHLYGKACAPEVFEICGYHNAWIVEDACESTFVPGIGKGHILTTSFFANHLISAGGGGVIMTNDSALDEYCWKLINHGRSARFGNDNIHQIAEKFHFDIWGHSMKWSDLPAALAKAQIERRHELYDDRIRNANILDKELQVFSDIKIATLPNPDGHCYMMYPIILAERLNVQNVIKDLNDEGIEVRRMMPITNQPVVMDYFKGTNLVEEYPVADMINRQGFYVGCHPELSEKDMQEMAGVIFSAIDKEGSRAKFN